MLINFDVFWEFFIFLMNFIGFVYFIKENELIFDLNKGIKGHQ